MENDKPVIDMEKVKDMVIVYGGAVVIAYLSYKAGFHMGIRSGMTTGAMMAKAQLLETMLPLAKLV